MRCQLQCTEQLYAQSKELVRLQLLPEYAAQLLIFQSAFLQAIVIPLKCTDLQQLATELDCVTSSYTG
jgi:hypothetical protein